MFRFLVKGVELQLKKFAEQSRLVSRRREDMDEAATRRQSS